MEFIAQVKKHAIRNVEVSDEQRALMRAVAGIEKGFALKIKVKDTVDVNNIRRWLRNFKQTTYKMSQRRTSEGLYVYVWEEDKAKL